MTGVNTKIVGYMKALAERASHVIRFGACSRGSASLSVRSVLLRSDNHPATTYTRVCLCAACGLFATSFNSDIKQQAHLSTKKHCSALQSRILPTCRKDVRPYWQGHALHLRPCQRSSWYVMLLSASCCLLGYCGERIAAVLLFSRAEDSIPRHCTGAD